MLSLYKTLALGRTLNIALCAWNPFYRKR